MSTRAPFLHDAASRYGSRYDELVHRVHVIVDGETPQKALQTLATQGVHIKPIGGTNDRFLQQVPSCRVWVSDFQLGFHSWRETGPYQNTTPYDYSTGAYTPTLAHVQLGRLGCIRLHCRGLGQPQACIYHVGSAAGGEFTASQGILATSRFEENCDVLTTLQLKTPTVPGLVHEEAGTGTDVQYLHTYPYYTLPNPSPSGQGIITQNPFGQTLTFRFSHPLTKFNTGLTNPPDYRNSTTSLSDFYSTPTSLRKGMVYWDDTQFWQDPPTDVDGLTGGNLAGDQTALYGLDPAAQAQIRKLVLPFSFTICIQPIVPVWSNVYPNVK